jgi:hypothetical protein
MRTARVTWSTRFIGIASLVCLMAACVCACAPAATPTSTRGATPPTPAGTSSAVRPTPTRLPPTATATAVPVMLSPSPVSPTIPLPTRTQKNAVSGLLTAPVLEEPNQGADAGGEAPVLRWHWERPLAENEYFDVRVWQEGQPAQGIAWAKEAWYEMRGLAGGKYSWSIAVLLHTGTRADGTKEWQPISAESEVRWFFYSPPSTPLPAETSVLSTPVQAPPSATPVPTTAATERPSPTRVSPSATAVPPPTATRPPVPPTSTSVPTRRTAPSPTRLPPTNTPPPATAPPPPPPTPTRRLILPTRTTRRIILPTSTKPR